MYNFLKKYGIVMGAYCPLARGGRDQKVILGDKIDYQSDQTLKQLSEKYSKSIYQLMLNYQIVRGVFICPKTEKL
jgi:diketogulonate reductase-like aldo/keto reductase